ncbi:hypothetical protein NEUTE1DRAFT_112573 [Neurospora tetrasperma FGSC 2508]|uniref:Uncharacterized protein n=1 Tax=Neurospora tetrasperma (strain FGSC 2508 / ATCC MYA-4615 / P0657) TaxID=510951 RepID=F8MVV6_NEUT8|nr:uncharacterized protein NEUTE1DRAFT_112573 [Neurospora tetrasperma FGSC 2508]EGO54004.1 hypothetical protein NEUTE1DRAFT_112573 [Neurospora tetrasperma FGSC 2508]EGZ68575.1 hypothetical protein NEUTE2DRAFT_142152 [Neurospora tetrasperma FGSC 2509]
MSANHGRLLIRLIFSSPTPTTPHLFPSRLGFAGARGFGGVLLDIEIRIGLSDRYIAGGHCDLDGSATLAPEEAIGVSAVVHRLKKCWNGQGGSPDPHFAKPEALSASYIVGAFGAYIWDDEKAVSQPHVGRLYSYTRISIVEKERLDGLGAVT